MASRPEGRAARRHEARVPPLGAALLLHVATLASFAGCATSPSGDRAATDESFTHLRTALAAYDSAGFMVGPADFPVVGRTVVVAGPGDSVFIGFAASLPPDALRFARSNDFVVARYQVAILVLTAGDTIAHVDRREIVRVSDFAETTSREPRIVFQRFIQVPEGRHDVEVTVRELTSRKEARGTFRLDARRGLSPPLLAHRAETRSTLGEPPPILLHARSTADATGPPPVLFVEDGTGPEGPATVVVTSGSTVLWADTLRLEAVQEGPAGAITALPVRLLPPGAANLRVERPGVGTEAQAPLYIGLSPEWTFPTWEASIGHLEYALEDDSLAHWRGAGDLERIRLWSRFQDRTDPDPSTPGNEYLGRYFDRMSQANDLFDEPGRAGWETDRGEVLVKLGEPDRQRFVRPERQGEVPRIEWEYDESIPTSATIVFEDASDFGVFVLTPRSRATLRRVVRELAGEERSE